MSTPYSPQDNPGQQPQERIVYVEKKKKGGCMKWGAIILGILIVIGIISAVVGGGDDTSSTSSDNNTSSEAAPAEGGESAAPAESNEPSTLQVGETYTGGKNLDVTINSFQAVSSPLGSSLACAQVTYVNNGDEQASFQGFWDWKAQNPAGVITDPTFSGENDLSTGELAPGGTVAGSVCFEGAEPGEYQVTYDPSLSFSSDTATWVAAL